MCQPSTTYYIYSILEAWSHKAKPRPAYRRTTNAIAKRNVSREFTSQKVKKIRFLSGCALKQETLTND